jgi:hypothetical protein
MAISCERTGATKSSISRVSLIFIGFELDVEPSRIKQRRRYPDTYIYKCVYVCVCSYVKLSNRLVCLSEVKDKGDYSV